MSPDEVLAAVQANGVKLTRAGLAWYHRQGMIARPVVRALGRGRGKESIYPPDTAAEVIAGHSLLGPWTPAEGFFKKVRVAPEDIARVREWAHSTTVGDIRRARHLTPREAGWPPLVLAQEWLARRVTVLAGEPRWVPLTQMLGDMWPGKVTPEGESESERDPSIPDDTLLSDLPGVPVQNSGD